MGPAPSGGGAASAAPLAPPVTEPPTADGPALAISAVAPQPPAAPETATSEAAKVAVGRRVATMATSALAAMRLRQAQPPREPEQK